MRRSEFLISDREVLDPWLAGAQWGVLGLVDSSVPYQVPVNPVLHQGSIWFHSALAGRKMSILKNSPEVHFAIVEPLSLIPSYFTSEKKACNATHFFLSIMITGRAIVVTDLELKAEVLSALMKKYQPEGRHEPISTSDETYRAEVKRTGLIQITPESITGKFKLGQNISPEGRQNIIAMLRQRGGEKDNLTADLMEKFG